MPKARAELRGANAQTARTSSDVRAAPDAAKAQGYFERALAVARQQQAKSRELRAAMSMARLWRHQSKRQEAHDLLPDLWLVHRGLRYVGLERGQGASGAVQDMTEIRNWLESIVLGNTVMLSKPTISTGLLTQVDDQMLKDIGVSSADPRLRVRNAIAKLAPAPIAEVNFKQHHPPA
jgi:hypothetical protein